MSRGEYSFFIRNRINWSFTKILRRVVEILRTEGIRSLGFKILQETVYRRMFLFARRVDTPGPKAATSFPVVCSLLGIADIPAYCEFSRGESPLTVRRRLAAGHICFVARRNGRIVHARWAAFRNVWINYLNCPLSVAADEAYVYASHTACDMRGRNLSPTCAAWMIQNLKRRGYRRLLAVVVPENKWGVRAIQKAGYHQLGTLGYIRIGPWRHDFFRASNMPVIPGKSVLTERARWLLSPGRFTRMPPWLPPSAANTPLVENPGDHTQ